MPPPAGRDSCRSRGRWRARDVGVAASVDDAAIEATDVWVVMIECPLTDRGTPTGDELTDLAQFQFVGHVRQTAICVHCREAHTWTRRDAWIERHTRPRVPGVWPPGASPAADAES
jgi:hypothetical protein